MTNGRTVNTGEADEAGAGTVRYADDAALNEMLASVVTEVKKYAEVQAGHIRRLNEIGIALSAEQNLDRLLEMILEEARSFSRADGGTLYTVDHERQCLDFAIVQNESMHIRMGGAGQPITWPSVPLLVEGTPNYANVSSYVALTGEIVNIPDVYTAEGFDFSGPRKYDATTGYRSRSMVVIPMRNKEDEIIGVLQLINALDPGTGEVLPFSDNDVALVSSLASQAAVALTNVRLYQDLERLFESFIVTIATAIDEKSPYTAGHIRRVQELTMAIAAAINRESDGVFKEFRFSGDELNELRIASWLHDVGKIITPEYVVDKKTKLETIIDGVDLVAARFDLLRKEARIRNLEAKLALYAGNDPPPDALAELDARLAEEERRLCEERDFVVRCNQPGEYLGEENRARLREIAAKRGEIDGCETPYLTDDELTDLSVVKGSLNDREREIIMNHALVTMKMLKCLPFPRRLRHVPEYASYHHEKLDGTGYPFRLRGDQLPLQTRIIAIADIFEALTAKDRPYKRPMSIAETLKIMEFMKKDGHIDADILELFVRDEIYRDYAERELDDCQPD
jgi:HD-GYP domain-containing protein (c-di-GMP phosphodiesterase class II)